MMGNVTWAVLKLATGVTLAPFTMGASVPVFTAAAARTLKPKKVKKSGRRF